MFAAVRSDASAILEEKATSGRRDRHRQKSRRPRQDFEVLIVSNDKEHDAAGGENIRTLKTSSGGAKGDEIVDEAKVAGTARSAAEKVVDYMALLGDSVDNIPAERIGEKAR